MYKQQYFEQNNFKNTHSVLESSGIFAQVSEAINTVIKNGDVQSHPTGISIIQQNSTDKDVYFILQGSFDIVHNADSITHHSISEILGEMSIVDPNAIRTATVTALEDSIVLHVEDEKFIAIANKYPRIWRNIASEISKRLRMTALR